jgi:serine/threonine-protein kinase RsbT
VIRDSCGAPAFHPDLTLASALRWVHVSIRDESDVVVARTHARELAVLEGLSRCAVEELVTATSEIVYNVVIHAKTGDLYVGTARRSHRRGVVIVVRDEGPGIPDIEQALQDGYSTGIGWGLGLSSAKRLMDEFELVSAAGAGTIVTMKKWADVP